MAANSDFLTPAALDRRLDSPELRERLARLYCCRRDETDAYADRCRLLMSDFVAHFGGDRPVCLLSAPGRTEIGGNHTDHQHGCVLAGGVNLDILAIAAANPDPVVRLVSDGRADAAVDIADPAPNPAERFQSRALIRGIASRFAAAGEKVGGFDACAVSSVKQGSGLSSSAAFEVLIGCVFNSLFCEERVSVVAIAQFGQYAENVHFGKPCGLMDQLACAEGGALFVDFHNEEEPLIRKIGLNLADYGHALCIIDSGADHADMSDAYADIPAEMCAVAACLGRQRLGQVDRRDFLADLPRIRSRVGDRAVLRALHFFSETQRAREEAQALADGRFAAFLELVRESGRSSIACLQNIHLPGAVRHQEVGFAIAFCEDALDGLGACRVHGGGFAGTIQAFVPLEMLDDFRARVEGVLGQGACLTLGIRPEGGVRLA